MFLSANMTSVTVLYNCLDFRKFQFQLQQSNLTTEPSVKLCFHLHALKHSMVFSVVTPSVAVWYSGTLDFLQLWVSVFQTNKSGHSKEIWFGHVAVSPRSALRKLSDIQSYVCGCVLCSALKTVQSFFLSADIHYYKTCSVLQCGSL